LGVPERSGGPGGDLEDAAVVVRAAATSGVAVPLAETALLAGWLLSEAGLAVPAGPLTAAVLREGSAAGVPYAGQAAGIAVLAESGDGWGVALLGPEDYDVAPGVNLAGEPRDALTVRRPPKVAITKGLDAATFQARGALARSIQIVGAVERILDLSLRHATEREQFGSKIERFQAVQQLLVTIAEELHAAGAAVESALAAPQELNIAIAKVRAGEAAGKAAAASHQLHGAIGFTQEHPLHHSTRRLWSWRDEFGTEAAWAARLGRLAAARGAERLWDLVTEEA